jgi:hypothetical protein
VCSSDLDLLEISHNAPWIEWGVLFHSKKEGQPRYPSLSWIEKLSGIVTRPISADGDGSFAANVPKVGQPKIKLAAHLCGMRCEEVLQGDPTFVLYLYSLGFRRVQLNATQVNGVDSSNLVMQSEKVIACIKSVPFMEWILQRNKETEQFCQKVVNCHADITNVGVLFDESAGYGIERKTFPYSQEHAMVPCGYAGGIGPRNIGEAIEHILDSAGKDILLRKDRCAIWIDMESSLRSITPDKRNIFSLDKVRQCVQIVEFSFGESMIKAIS